MVTGTADTKVKKPPVLKILTDIPRILLLDAKNIRLIGDLYWDQKGVNLNPKLRALK